MIGILSVSLLAGGTDAITTSVSAASAQVSTLGEPFLVAKGKITSQNAIHHFGQWNTEWKCGGNKYRRDHDYFQR